MSSNPARPTPRIVCHGGGAVGVCCVLILPTQAAQQTVWGGIIEKGYEAHRQAGPHFGEVVLCQILPKVIMAGCVLSHFDQRL